MASAEHSELLNMALLAGAHQDWMPGGMFSFSSFEVGLDSVVLPFDPCISVPGLQYQSTTLTAEMHFLTVLEV